MERLHISAPILEKMRAIRAAQLQKGSDNVIRHEEAIHLTLGLGPAIYLCFDGRVLIWHYMLDEPIRETSNIVEIAGAIVIAARNNNCTELLDLLPPKPDDGTTCQLCSGRRWAPVTTSENKPTWFVCPTCYGLGWQSIATN